MVFEEAGERIDLDAADDPRDVVHQAVAALAGGGLVLVPGDLGPLPLGLILNSCEAVVPKPGPGQARVLLPSAESLRDWVPGLSTRMRRMAERGWPGEVVFRFGPTQLGGLAGRLPAQTRALVIDDREGLGFQSPAHPFIRELLPLLPCPAFTLGESLGFEPSLRPRFRMIIESRSKKSEDGPTVVNLEGQGWSILRRGGVSPEELARMDGTMILFVCTGNTCRSPMAEALCKVLLAERLGCSPAQLPERGYLVGSAGVYASTGQSAARHAVDIVRARGGSLHEHFSRKLTPELVDKADLLIAMTVEHLEAMLDLLPESADRARLLHPDGLDVDDPYGADRGTYQKTADAIESYLGRLLDDLGIKPTGDA